MYQQIYNRENQHFAFLQRHFQQNVKDRGFDDGDQSLSIVAGTFFPEACATLDIVKLAVYTFSENENE